MKANEKGFSVVELLIVVVVVGLIGAVGWLVYNRQNNKPDSPQASQQSNEAATSSKPNAIIIPSDWQWFTSKDNSTKFAYPKSWGNLVEKTEAKHDTYDTKSFIGRVTISSKKDFLTQVPQGFEDYTWYIWNESSDALARAVDSKPPSDYKATYEKPVALGAAQDVKPLFEESKGRAMYEVQGKGAMNCGVYHYFFSVKDKVVHIPATLCTKDGEWKPQEGQAYMEEVTVPVKDFYKYIEE